MKVFINNRDNLERGFRRLVEWLQASDCDITVIDNASTWEPLIKYYDLNPKLKVDGIFNRDNLGPYAFWELGLHKQQIERFIVTDPDLRPCDLCPSAGDTIDWMDTMMNRWQAGKVGVSLSLANIPEYYSHAREVREWEQQFWDYPTADGLSYRADIDTTFAMYEPGSEVRNEKPCLRLASPYSFEHVPWYEDSSRPNTERDYYLAHIRKDWTDWSKR